MYNAREAERARRKELRERGICISCGKRSVDSGHVTCSECRERAFACGKRLRDDRKKNGICVKCGKHPAKTGRTRCEACAEKDRIRMRQERQRKSKRKTKRAEAVEPTPYTLCIECKHAVPSADGLWGCEWSLSFQPVPGWAAEKRVMNATGKNGSPYTSYRVKKCPKFVNG